MNLSQSFPPADALLDTLRRIDWQSLLNRYMDAVAVCCAFLVATWQHHRCHDRLRSAGEILAALVASGAAWAWETGRPAAILWVRETARPAVIHWASGAAMLWRGILTPPLTV